MLYVPAGVAEGIINVPSLSMVTPFNPSGSTIEIVISPSSTATPLSVSLIVTSPALPPVCPAIGVPLKSSSLAVIVAAFTSTVMLAVSQLPEFKFSQIWYTIV